MSGIAPLSGSTTTAASSGIADASPTRAVTPPVVTPAPQTSGASFTAFPSSYAGFGGDGSQFGTLSVVNGALSVVSPDAGNAPPGTPVTTAATSAAPQAATSQAATPKAPATQAATPPPAAQAAAANAAESPGAPPPPQTQPPLPVTVDAESHPADKTQPGDALPGTAQPATTAAPATPAATAAPAPAPAPVAGTSQPAVTAAQPQQPVEQAPADPTKGLIGAASSSSIPGSGSNAATPSLQPAQGLLGAPATNPIVIQAEDQQRAAAAEADAEADVADANKAADQVELQQINARIAAAREAGNAAAVAQLQPKQVAIVGDIQGQTFAGVGSTPPKPFVRPEIPSVFLNIAS